MAIPLRLNVTRCTIASWLICLSLQIVPLHTVRGDEPAVRLLPTAFTLSGPAARQSLVLESFSGTIATGQIRGDVKFTSSDPSIVKIEEGRAVGVANGKAVITAMAGDRRADCEVTVVAMDQPFAWSFRNHVESVLSKAGCNSGACHGALAGKKGFRLSLGAFDPVSDYFYITRQARSRRVVPSDPGRSLVLTKPTGAVPHKGGVRFGVDSPEYEVLAQWIAAGAPPVSEDDPRLLRLEILPARSVLVPGCEQQILVRAHFSDLHSEDVTRWVKFTSTNESVASVDPLGKVLV
ncbi:MAG TPA: Ig-like domain-containing protein, partial [Pirellulales bacterium]|nr:Ig-like domain-containing protein [Pirellulales bacterium]